MDASINEVTPVGIMESCILNQGPPTPEVPNSNTQIKNDNYISL